MILLDQLVSRDKQKWYLTVTLSKGMDERAYIKTLNNIKGSNLNF